MVADVTEKSATRGMTVEMSFMARHDRENARSIWALGNNRLVGKMFLRFYPFITWRDLGPRAATET